MTVEPMALAPMPPPNMSDRPPPLPLCSSTRTIMISEAVTLRIVVMAVITVVESPAGLTGRSA